jgi:hypothetical protein
METINPVKFVSLSDALTTNPDGSYNDAKAQTLVVDMRKPSERFPQGIALMGDFYSPEILDHIENDIFWINLPNLGSDQEFRIERIKELLPITGYCPDPRVNRRKLYLKILWLRTESKVGWEFDKKKSRFSAEHIPVSPILHTNRLNHAIDLLQARSGEIADNTVRSIKTTIPRIGASR